MNRRVVLDTNAYSHLFRGDVAVLEVLGEAERVYVPVTVLGELLAGFRMGNREEKNRRELKEFLARPTVRVLPTTEDVAAVDCGPRHGGGRRAGELRYTLWVGARTDAVGRGTVIITNENRPLAGPPFGTGTPVKTFTLSTADRDLEKET